MLAPVGTVPDNVNVKVFAGISTSVAAAVKVSALLSFTDFGPIDERIGASFTAVTFIVMVLAL